MPACLRQSFNSFTHESIIVPKRRTAVAIAAILVLGAAAATAIVYGTQPAKPAAEAMATNMRAKRMIKMPSQAISMRKKRACTWRQARA